MTTPRKFESMVELGRSLQFLRSLRRMTLRELAKAAAIAPQYIHNMETGRPGSVSDEYYAKLAKGLGVDQSIVDDLVLKARIMTALERRGLDADKRAFVWRGLEHRLTEVGLTLRSDIQKLVDELI